MRSLRNQVRRFAAAAPALLAGSICGACDAPQEHFPAIVVGSFGGASAGAAGAPILIVVPSNGGGSGGMPSLQINLGPIGGTGADPCQPMITELPEAGPANLAQICATGLEPASSNGAVRVGLESDASEPTRRALGKLRLVPEIRDSVLGAPVVTVLATHGEGVLPVMSKLTLDEQGDYGFTLDWPEGASLAGNDDSRVALRSSFDVRCESGGLLVNAFTELHLCGGVSDLPLAWAGPGDNCAVCPRIGGERKKR